MSDFNKKPLLQRIKWTNAFFLVLSPIAAFTLAPLDVYWNGLDSRLMIFCLVLTVATSMSITGGYHRLFAHRSYDSKWFIKLFYLLFGAASVQGSALKWCSDHRRHHREVDTEDDPYNIKKGFFYAHVGWVFLKEDPKYNHTYYNDLSTDPMIAWQHKHITLLTVLVGFGFPTLIGWYFGNALSGLVWGGFVRVVFTHHSTFFINSLCHMVGSQPYSDKISARDSYIMSIFAYGEGYHNFHHHFASDYRNGIRWYHWDPTKWIVSGLSYIGWTYRLKRTSPATILKARISMDEKRLLAQGAAAERIELVKKKIEAAQLKWRTLKEEYAVKRREMETKSRWHMKQLKAEMKASKMEFKAAWYQWMAYKRELSVSY